MFFQFSTFIFLFFLVFPPPSLKTGKPTETRNQKSFIARKPAFFNSDRELKKLKKTGKAGEKGRKGILIKLHERRDAQGVTKRVLAACDEELLGKTFTSKNGFLDLKTYAGFYNGAKASGDEAVEIMRSADNLNLVGEKSIALAKKAFAELSEKNVRKIKGVPHLQLYKI